MLNPFNFPSAHADACDSCRYVGAVSDESSCETACAALGAHHSFLNSSVVAEAHCFCYRCHVAQYWDTDEATADEEQQELILAAADGIKVLPCFPV